MKSTSTSDILTLKKNRTSLILSPMNLCDRQHVRAFAKAPLSSKSSLHTELSYMSHPLGWLPSILDALTTALYESYTHSPWYPLILQLVAASYAKPSDDDLRCRHVALGYLQPSQS